jgi:lysyl-tRNA synthetase, class II
VATILSEPTFPADLEAAALARLEARALVERYGSDTLSYFKLRPDTAYHFSADRRAFAGYAVVGSTLLVAGDPVGAPDAVDALIGELRELAGERGLRLGALGASEQAHERFRAAGLRTLYIGDEALVDTAAFTLEGRPIRKVRQSVSRLRRLGYSSELLAQADASDETLAELDTLRQRALHGARECSFAWSMEGIGGEHQRDCVVVIARDPDGAARGVLQFAPTYGRPALSLSIMRRDDDTPNGLMEYLVVTAIEQARDRGIAELSLNFAAFGRWVREPRSRVEWLGGRAAHVGSRFVQMESLYRFNAKFFPRWEPRYLVYDRRLGLLRTGLAAMRIEGQMSLPRRH